MKAFSFLQAHRYSSLCLTLSGIGAILYAFCLPLSLAAENTSFFIMLIFLVLSGNWQEKGQIIKRNPIAWFAIGLTLLYLLGTLYSSAPWKISLWIFKKQAELIFIALLIPLFFDNAIWKARCYKAFVAGAIFVFIIGALNMLGIFDAASLFHKQPQTAAFPLFFHIYAATFLAFASYIAAHLACQSGRLRWVFIVSWLIISFDVLFMSISRTGYLLYFMLMLVFLIQKCTFKQLVLGVFGLIITCGLAYHFSASFHYRVDQAFIGTQAFHSNQTHYATSSGVRLDYAVKSYDLWKEKPLFGYGTAGFQQAYININGITAGGASLSSAANPQVSPENTFYFIAIEHGLLGLSILIAMLIVQWRSSFTLADQLDRHIAQALVLTFILASFSAPMLLDESPRLFFVFFSSLLFASLSKRTK
ncbi:MAG: O-antigen ligase family protein [Gammaproteobacteria bacterium]|nr:O-antigen ligase family protein [Gammaproteobacteria bacterium]